jgi:hypothetical protein
MSLVERVAAVLSGVQFQNYEFKVREGHGGAFIQAFYVDADVYTMDYEQQVTRKWLVSPEMTDSEIVSTAFKCAMTSMEHRCREEFLYKGARIFGPHFDVEDLVKLCRDGREAAGGRDFSKEAP